MLKDHEDALGHAVYDYLNGMESYEITERSDCYLQPEIGPRGYFRQFPEWALIERKAARYVRGRVLDVGCGAGRHSLYFQDKGHEVVGIDISPLAVEVCRERGLKDARMMSVSQINSRLGVFDTILMLGGNFGLFGGYAKAKRLLVRFSRITPETGRIITTSTDPYQMDEFNQSDYMTLNRKMGRMPGQLRTRARYKTYATPWTDFLLVSKEEMNDIVSGTGWYVRKFIETGSARYTAIIEKKM